MRNLLYKLTILTILLSSCSVQKKAFVKKDQLDWSQSVEPNIVDLEHTLYLIGDIGNIDNKDSLKYEVFINLSNALKTESENTSLVFLGDNIGPKGMPYKNSPHRSASEDMLENIIQTSRLFSGNTYLIPGENDWNSNGKEGLKAIKRQAEYLKKEKKKSDNISWVPKAGCGDPEVIKINKDLVFIFLDSQWWLQEWDEESEINQGCEVQSRGDLIVRLGELFLEYKNDKVVLLMHHPMKSNGNYGGNFSIWQNIFPFKEKKIWIPIPIIGSFYPIFRKVGGTSQDLANDQYQELMKGIEKSAATAKVDIIYASGHEHGLQLFDTQTSKHIVSGSGSKAGYLIDGGQADFLHAAKGYVKLKFYKGSEVWVEFISMNDKSKLFTTTFKKQLFPPEKGTTEEIIIYPTSISGDTSAVAYSKFKASKFQELMLGSNYRDLWNTAVKVPFIDINKEGLKPVKIGGGMSSISLRLENKQGQEYILRSIVKVTNRQVPKEYRNLKMLFFLEDQNSANFLFGPLMIPTLSKAVDVYYTNPKMVYLKHQEALGNYNEFLPEGLYFLEERPNDDWSNSAQFGYSNKIISYADLLDNLKTDDDHFIDQAWTLKTRIFDLWIHDWDRHDDQYRWARVKDGDKKIYRPIPRDRDLAFYSPNGLFPFFISNFLLRKLKPFKKKVSDIKGLAFNSKHFDRFFLNNLDREDWMVASTIMKTRLTDKVIDTAISQLPLEAQFEESKIIKNKLQKRRDDLVAISMSLYDELAKEVDIVGHDGKDEFNVTIFADRTVRVEVKYKIKKSKDFTKFDRTFYPKETNEIRLFGLRGDDDFNIEGVGKSKIKIRIIGGEGDDEVKNETKGKRINVYDEIDGISLKGDNINDKTSNDVDNNDYNRYGFSYNEHLFSMFLGSTPDDGFWLGGGLNWTTKKWRAEPYKSKQSIKFQIAPTSRGTLILNYHADFTNVIGKLDFAPKLSVNFPKYENFFGYGNESNSVSDDISYHWVRMNSIEVTPLLKMNTSRLSHLYFGPMFTFNNPVKTDGRVSGDLELGFSEEELKHRNYLGINIGHSVSFIDNIVFPSNGFKLNGSISHQYEWNKSEHVTKVDIESVGYIRVLARPKLVIGNAIGFKKMWGDLRFYQYASLGNNAHLRGFRNSRYRGESMAYHNIDVRIELLKWNNNYIPADFGLLLGFDYGRVWLDDEDSDLWHSSTTVGIWANLLGLAIVNPHYSFTPEGNVFALRMGFDF